MKRKDFAPGVVVALSGRVLKALPSVRVMDQNSRLEELPDEERLFLCVGVSRGFVQLAEITSQGREERLFIRPGWRGVQSGYGSLRISRWRVGRQYLNGAAFVGEAQELCSAALSPQSAGRFRIVTDEGLAVVRAHLAPRLKAGQSLFPWAPASPDGRVASHRWKFAA